MRMNKNRCPVFTTMLLIVSLVIVPAQVSAERIKDVTSIAGVRTNQLIGYGLVVGLEEPQLPQQTGQCGPSPHLKWTPLRINGFGELTPQPSPKQLGPSFSRALRATQLVSLQQALNLRLDGRDLVAEVQPHPHDLAVVASLRIGNPNTR